MARILSIGECMVELAPAGTDGHLRKGFAGDTFNTAWYLRQLLPTEHEVAYFTALGDDALSRDMLAFMQGAGVDVSHIRRLPKRAPGLYLITLDGHERSFTYWRDTSAARSLADDEAHLRQAVERADVLYTSGITLAILPPEKRELLVAVLREAREAGRTVAFDPNIRERLWPNRETLRAAIEAAAAVASICLPSFDDERTFFGDADPQATFARYHRLGAREVVVKDGGDSALVGESGSPSVVEPESVGEPKDTTGAGDSFGAGYIAARLQGAAPAEAAARAHRVAAKVIQGYGALVEINAAS